VKKLLNNRFFIISSLLFTILLLGGYGTEITQIDIRFALMVQDMTRYGIGLFPTINNVEYGDYPSGWVWCAWVTTFGGRLVNQWLLTLPCIIAGITTLVMTWRTGECIGSKIGLYAAALLWGTPGFLYLTAGFGIDVPVMAAGSIMLYFLGRKTSASTLGWIFFILLIFVFCTRGPMGFVLLGAGVGGYLLAEREWEKVLLCGATGAVTSLLCIFLWYWTVQRQGGEALWKWFLHCQFLSRMGKSDYSTYFVDYLFSFAPVTLLAVGGILFRRTRERLKPLLGIIGYILLPLIILSIPACKHSRYMAMTLPAFAILSACVWAEIVKNPSIRSVLSKIAKMSEGRIYLLMSVGILILAIIGYFISAPKFLPWGHFLCAVLLIAGLERMGGEMLRRFVPIIAFGIFLIVAVFPLLAALENSQNFVNIVERECPEKVYLYEMGPDHDDLKYVLFVPPEKRHRIHYLYSSVPSKDGYYQRMYPAKTLDEQISSITENDLMILRNREAELVPLKEEAKQHGLKIEIKHTGSMGHREFVAVRLIRQEISK